MQQISKSWQALLDQVPLSSVCLIDKVECGKPCEYITAITEDCTYKLVQALRSHLFCSSWCKS